MTTLQLKRRWPHLRRFIGPSTVALVCLWLLGQWLRDWSWLSGLCFYIPSPFLTGWLLLLALASLRKKRVAVCYAGLAVLPLFLVLFVENNFATSPTPTSEPTFRVVHWNVGARLYPDVLQAHDADLYVLSEIPNAKAVENFRASLGEAYSAAVFDNLAVIGRGQVRAEEWLIRRGRVKLQTVHWRHAEQVFTLFVVDLPSELHIHREPLLREVNRFIEERQPDLIVGDFNAPRRSRALSDLPTGYRHAYDAVGEGWGYTWPVPVPLYALDQCIYSPRLRAQRYELVTSTHSDHRLQVFEFSLNNAD
jgi:vancomycin resistance protein VanJ